MISLGEIFGGVGMFIFTFWWIILPSVMIRSRETKRFFAGGVIWGFLAILRLVALFQNMNTGFIIPEPFNSLLFVIAGIAILVFWFFYDGNPEPQDQNESARKTVWGNKATLPKEIEELLALSPMAFENLITDLYNKYGHEAIRTGRSGDHGVDIYVKTKQGERVVVQCKRWRGYVGEKVVRDFYGVIQHEKAERGVIITTGTFSNPARRWANGKPINLIDGKALVKRLKQLNQVQKTP